MLDESRTENSPVAGLKVKGAVWVRPELIVEVEYHGITEDGQLRHPSFQRVRDDR
jgi:bifunctional non-homologous end joining protein LigD